MPIGYKNKRLQACIKTGKYQKIVSLVEKGKGVNLNLKTPQGCTMIFLAAKHAHWNIVELLIDLGADINITAGKSKLKIMHYAAIYNWLPLIEIFIDKKLELDQKNPSQVTPLMLAAMFNRQNAVTLLVKAGANITSMDNMNRTALHYAAGMGNTAIVQFLVSNGANINAQCRFGTTPFHSLLRRTNDIHAVCFLMEGGADCNLKDIWGNSGFNILIKRKCVDAIILSIQNGAYVSSCDYAKLVTVPSLKSNILTNKFVCSESIINKHNKYLKDIYKVPVASDVLPQIGMMKIKDTSAIAAEIDRVVDQDIAINGFCNLGTLQPLSLSLICVKSFHDYMEKAKFASNQTNSSGV